MRTGKRPRFKKIKPYHILFLKKIMEGGGVRLLARSRLVASEGVRGGFGKLMTWAIMLAA